MVKITCHKMGTIECNQSIARYFSRLSFCWFTCRWQFWHLYHYNTSNFETYLKENHHTIRVGVALSIPHVPVKRHPCNAWRYFDTATFSALLTLFMENHWSMTCSPHKGQAMRAFPRYLLLVWTSFKTKCPIPGIWDTPLLMCRQTNWWRSRLD